MLQHSKASPQESVAVKHQSLAVSMGIWMHILGGNLAEYLLLHSWSSFITLEMRLLVFDVRVSYCKLSTLGFSNI